MEILGAKIGQFEEAMRIDLAEEAQERGEQVLDMLQQKLAEAHGIIHEQDQLLQAALTIPETRKPGPNGTQRSRRRVSYDADSSKNGPENDTQDLDITPPRSYRVSPDYSLLETYAEDMEFEKQALGRKQKHLEQDRKLLQERAVQLDKDRLEFEVRIVLMPWCSEFRANYRMYQCSLPNRTIFLAHVRASTLCHLRVLSPLQADGRIAL